MRLLRVTTVVLALLAGLVLPGSASALPSQMQWSATPSEAVAQPNASQSYALGHSVGGGLISGNRNFGVDLEWGGRRPEWQFRRANPRDHRGIPPTERMALYSTRTRRYLAYGRQTFGINLVWSATPKYEWQIQTPGPVVNNIVLSLYNTTAGSYLVYTRRTVGINLGWQR
jgi:hypothetical protein